MANLLANMLLRVRTQGVQSLTNVARQLNQVGRAARAAQTAAAKGVAGADGRLRDPLTGRYMGGGGSRGFGNWLQKGANLNQISEAAGRLRSMLYTAVSSPIEQFASFEEAMLRVKGQMGANTEGFERLKAAALDVGKSGRVGADEAARGFEQLTTLGFNVTQQLNMLPSVLTAARAGALDLSEAAELAGKSLHQFGLDSSKTTHVMDVLQTAAASSATDLRSLGETMKYVGPNAHDAGLSLEYTAQMAMLLSNSGVDASMAGTSLRTALMSLVKDAPKARKELHRLGFTSKEAGNFITDPVKGLQALDAAMKKRNYSVAQRERVLSKIFGTEGVTGASILMRGSTEVGDDGHTAWERAGEAIGKADGALKRFDTTMQSSTASKIRALKGLFENWLINTGERMSPVIDSLEKTLPGVLDKLGPKVADIGAKLPAMLEKLPSVVDKLIPAVSRVLDQLGRLADFLADHPDLAAILAGGIAVAPAASTVGSVVSGVGGAIGGIAGAVGLTGLLSGGAGAAGAAGAGAAGAGAAGAAAAGGGLLAPVLLGIGAAAAGWFTMKKILDDQNEKLIHSGAYQQERITRVNKMKAEARERIRLQSGVNKVFDSVAQEAVDPTLLDPWGQYTNRTAADGSTQVKRSEGGYYDDQQSDALLEAGNDLKQAAADLSRTTVTTVVKIEDNRTTTTTTTTRPRAGGRPVELR